MRINSLLVAAVAAAAVAFGGAHAVASGGGGNCKGTGQWAPDAQGNPAPVGLLCFGTCPPPPVGAVCTSVVASQNGPLVVAVCGCTNLPNGGTTIQIDRIDPDGPGPIGPQLVCDVIEIVDHSQNPPVTVFLGCSGVCANPSSTCTEDVIFDEGGHKLVVCWCP